MVTFAQKIKNTARKIGFDAVGITSAEVLQESGADLQEFVQQGLHGEMNWLRETHSMRSDPRSYFPGAESVIMVALNYYRDSERLIMPRDAGNISIYARGRDYHRVLRSRLRNLLDFICQKEPDTRGRIFVDSFPVMEKPLAVRAGLGWIARNTVLILKNRGSFFFLGGILLNLPLPADQPFTGQQCGTCTRCLEACPTGAITAPFRLDASKCLSYLTIEHKSEISRKFHRSLGNHIFGCDICQAVCPWNIKFSRKCTEGDFNNRWDPSDLSLEKLARLTQPQYEKMFEGTPVRRSGYRPFIRNVNIAQINSSSGE